MAQKSLPQVLVGTLVDFLEDARDLLTGEDTRRALIADLGGNPSSPTTPPTFPPAGLDSAKAYRDNLEPDLESMFAAIQDVRACIETIRSFVDSLHLDNSQIANEVFRDLLDLLGINFVRLRLPRLYYFMQAVSFVEDFSSVYGGEFGGFMGLAQGMRSVNNFIWHPCSWFDQTNFDDEEGVRKISDRTLFAFAAASAYGKGLSPADVYYGWDLVPGVPGSDTPTAVDRTLARTLTMKFKPKKKHRSDPPPPAVTGLASLALLPRTQGGPGLFGSFGGSYEFDLEISNPWHLCGQIHAAGGTSFLVSHDRGLEIEMLEPGTDVRAGVAFEARPDPLTNKALVLELGKNTGISVGLLRFEIAVAEPEATFKTVVRNGVLSIGRIFDGFLDNLIPSDGLRVIFDFGVGVGTERGYFLEGHAPSIGSSGAASNPTPPLPPPGGPVVPPPLPPLPRPAETGPGVSVRIPIGKSLLFLTIHDIQLRVGLEGDADNRTYLLDVGTSFSITLGPVLARIDRLGVRLAAKFPDDPGAANLGFMNLDVGALMPTGVGIAIDAKGLVSGGGFIFHDREQQLYAGVLELTIQNKLTVKAFGLIGTRMPDGSKGYSLIVFLTVEFSRAYPLGMGLTLQGIGGMVAINRTFNAEAMREGLKNNTLATLLFPRDPIRNAPEIIRNLGVVFPAKAGIYLFGLIVKLGWFSPTLVLLELALILEFTSRRVTRLIVLGRISSMLPSRQEDLVRLNLDAMGLIDFDEGTASIDATLVDSRLARKFVLSGDMALRARWTSGPGAGFVLAIGGFNPRFAPPANLPALTRITIALAAGNNPRLTCEAYFALTSNTIQFGAHAALYAAAYGFSIEGDLGFDVLIQLVPFHFIADFHASIQLKRGSRSLFKVSLVAALEGPRPLRVSGKASFEILWCDFSVRFDKTLIEGEKPPLPPAVNVLDELTRALATAESWSTVAAINRQHGVTLRELKPGGTLVLDPLGNLMVKQAVVPLNTTRDIETFGGAPVAGARRFTLTATLNNDPQQVGAPVTDQFVPAQFFNMSDDERLASPSFEEMDAGVVFGSDLTSFDESNIVAAPLTYETIVIDDAGQSVTSPDRYGLSIERLLQHTRFGAVAQAPIRSVGVGRFRNDEAPKAATLRSPRWVIASVSDTAVRALSPGTGATWSESRAAMAALNRGAPRGATGWQLVPVHETSDH